MARTPGRRTGRATTRSRTPSRAKSSVAKPKGPTRAKSPAAKSKGPARAKSPATSPKPPAPPAAPRPSATFLKFIAQNPSYYTGAYASRVAKRNMSATLRAHIKACVAGPWATTMIKPRTLVVAVVDKADFDALAAAAAVTPGGAAPAFPQALGSFGVDVT